MAANFRFKIKNPYLALLALLGIALFCGLGTWQLSRGHEKQTLIDHFTARTQALPLTADLLIKSKDLRFYRATLIGHFDNQHSFLLDNKIFHGKVGYELYTPFQADGIAEPILIDRGFIPLGQNRNELPGIDWVIGKVKVIGMIDVPPAYIALGKMLEQANSHWPLRVEFIQLDQLASLINAAFYPYILRLEPQHPAAYETEWQIISMKPERHFGYAVQWFALALTLLILFAVLNIKRSN